MGLVSLSFIILEHLTKWGWCLSVLLIPEHLTKWGWCHSVLLFWST